MTNSHIKIESVLSSDFEQLYSIETAAYIIPWSYGALLNNQGDNYINLKIILEQQIIGFIIGQITLDEANIFNITIHPNYQGRGFGKILLQEFIHKLNDKASVIWLEVRESNLAAQNLYKNLNFKNIAIRKNYYPTEIAGQKENAIIMQYKYPK